MRENGSIVQRATDCHKAIKGHREKHRGFQERQAVDEKELGKASVMTNVSCPHPKDAEHCRKGAERQTQVSQSQHGQEEVHRLVEGGLCLDDKKNCAVAQDGNQIQEAEWEGDPDVHVFQPGDATQQEGRGHAAIF